MERKFFKLNVLSAIILILCILVFGGFSDTLGKEGGTKFKTVNVALNAAPNTLDPAAHGDRSSQTVIRNITDGLMQSVPDGTYALDIAESIKEIDPITYEIKIKKGIRFHNGDPLTVDDVIFSCERFLKSAQRKVLMGPVDSIDKVDDYTIIYRLKQPNVVQNRRWYHLEMMPKKYIEKVGIDEFAKRPIGVGPFKYVEGDVKTFIVLERNNDYYGGSATIPGKVDRIPALDRVIFHSISEPATRVAALLTGEIDITQYIPIDMVELLKKNPNIKISNAPGTVMVLLALNVTKPPFDDVRVRRAIAYAINYKQLVDAQFKGYASILRGLPFREPLKNSMSYGKYDNLKGFEYSPENAKALVKEVGKDINMVIDSYSDYVEPAQAIAQMLNEVGINASVRSWDWGVLSKISMAGERTALLTGNGNAQWNEEWISKMLVSKGHANYSQYSNPIFDELVNKARKLPESNPERFELFKKAFEIVMDEVPMITIYSPDQIDAYRSHVKNFHAYFDSRVNLHRVDVE